MDPMTPTTAIDDLQARARSAGQPEWFALDVQNRTAVLRIFDSIGGWYSWFDETSANDVVEQLDALGDVDEIRVEINSPGGSVFGGITITNALRNHPARIVTRVEGLAASIASVIFLAGDERQMSPGAQLMIHNAWGGVVGDASELRKQAEILEQQNRVLADLYAEASERNDGPSLSAAEFLDLMADETWLNADEAVEFGLADIALTRPSTNSADDSTPEPSSSDTDDNDEGDLAAADRSLTLALLDLS